MNIDDNISECLTPCIVKSKYFFKEIVMDDSSSDFQEKKKYNTGPKNVKAKVSKPKKPLKKIKHQRDIRTLIKNKNSELVSYSKNFDQVCKESGVDVDSEQLQLAIALSKSLQESETKSVDNEQQSKPLTSQERSAKIRTTLQEYGFRVPNTKISKDLSKRRKFKKQYKLLLASDEEKQITIADKYAEVLAKNIHKSPSKNNNTSNNYNDQELFYKATNIIYDLMRNDDVFYIKDLIEKPIIKTCLLRDWSTIPGRPVSPKREEKNFNFDNIECKQDELDVILSGSIHAAQSIVESKDINSCNINISNERNPVMIIDVGNITTFAHSELEDQNSTNIDITKETINSEAHNYIDTMSMISQKVRSVSPDIFDDDITLTLDDTNVSIPVLKENTSQSKDNNSDVMDLTECVNIAPERDKTKNVTILSIKKINVSMKSSNLMEITECVPTTAKECHIENIDLTQGFHVSQKENYSNNIDVDSLEMDLTQSLNSDDVLSEETGEVTPKQVLNKEKLGSKTNTRLANDECNTESNNFEGDNIHIETSVSFPTKAKECNIENIDLTQSFHSKKQSFTNILETENLEMDLTQSSNSDVDIAEETLDGRKQKKILEETILKNDYVEVISKEIYSSKKDSISVNHYKTKIDVENSQNFISHIVEHKDSDSHLYEYYVAKKSIRNVNKEKFETDNLSTSPKESLIENIDLTQNFNYSKENYSNTINKINVTKRKSNDLMEITECVPTNTEQNLIDNIDLTQSFSYSNTNDLLPENIQIDLTQSLHSDKVFPLVEVTGTKTSNSIDDIVVIIGDSEFNSDSEPNEVNKDLILQNDTKILKIDDHNRKEDNNKSNTMDKKCENHSLSKNVNDYEYNISYSEEYCDEVISNIENDRNSEMDLTQYSDSDSDQIAKIDARENEGSLDTTVLITEDVESNPIPDKLKDDSNKLKENNEPNNCNDNSNDNFYSYSENVYNSYVFDHNDNDLPENNSQDDIVIKNMDVDNKTPSYTEHDRNSDKIKEDKSGIEKLDNIDLTQNSHSSNEPNENEYILTYNTNLGKIDNVSIDYDEMFDNVVSIGSKVASTSLKSINNSNDSIKKADNSKHEASNPSETSGFEISDKEFNYSLHQSRHNFDIGGLSVLDNVSDFKMQSINENNRHSKTNLNRSHSDSDLHSTSAKKITHHTPKAVSNSNNFIHESSTPVINKCVIQEVQNTPKNSEYIIKTYNVTPMLDYEAMTSPERNRELEKYGLKPFKRKRAIQLLKHLYEQTHPVVESCDIEECSSPSKRRKYDNGSQYYNSLGKPKTSPRKSPKKIQKSPRKQEFDLAEADKENSLYAETKDTPDIKEVKCLPEDWVFQKREKAKVHSCKVPLHIAFHNYVSCRRLLREAILRYEPINIDVIHKELVASGYKYNPKDLLRFLDRKCITVKTADNNTRNRKS